MRAITVFLDDDLFDAVARVADERSIGFSAAVRLLLHTVVARDSRA